MWVARDENGGLNLWKNKPTRHLADRNDYPEDYPKDYPIVGFWVCGFDIAEEGACGTIPDELFPDLKWEDEPMEITLEPFSEIKDTYKELNKYYLKDFKIRDILHELNIRQDVLAMSEDVKGYLQQITDIIYEKESENKKNN